MESALMISTGKNEEISIARRDFPEPVAPIITTTFGFVLSSTEVGIEIVTGICSPISLLFPLLEGFGSNVLRLRVIGNEYLQGGQRIGAG